MNIIQKLLMLFILVYRIILSPVKNALFGPTGACRFSPCCSAYTLEAIELHGAIKGALLGLKRILRCNPWGKYGHDPVPRKNDTFQPNQN